MKLALIAATAVLAALAAPARADGPHGTSAATATASASATRYLSKKDQYLLDKAAAPTPKKVKLPVVGKPPARLINLYNTWTDEWLAVDAVKPVVPAPVVNTFLRCHFTNEPTDMEDRLIATVVEAANHFNVTTVEIVSGFRHPKYNLMLRKKGHQVARDSQHTHGNAIDFWLPGIAIPALHDWAKSKHMGGVGLYLGSGFVHMDTGPIRFWNGE